MNNRNWESPIFEREEGEILPKVHNTFRQFMNLAQDYKQRIEEQLGLVLEIQHTMSIIDGIVLTTKNKMVVIRLLNIEGRSRTTIMTEVLQPHSSGETQWIRLSLNQVVTLLKENVDLSKFTDLRK